MTERYAKPDLELLRQAVSALDAKPTTAQTDNETDKGQVVAFKQSA